MGLAALRKWIGRHPRDHGEGWAEGDQQALLEPDGPHEDHDHDAAPEDASAVPSAWSSARIDVAEALWGDGCLMPGGTDEILRLAIPLGLSPASSLLLLGGGTGGGALRLASELGVWVCMTDSDAMVTATAARRVQRSGNALAKRATVQGWDPAAPAFRHHGYHHVLAIESLGGPQPEATLASLAQSVRPAGQIAVIETIATEPVDDADPTMAAWCRLEHRVPPRVGTEWLTRPLEQAGFEIRVAEDLTARQVGLAVAGWKLLVREMRVARPPPRRAAAVLAEAELWMHRVRLLRSGRMRVMRWHLTSGG